MCVCPLNQFGSRCFLSNSICQVNANSTCQSGGQCVRSNDHLSSSKSFRCISPKESTGDRYEIASNRIIFSFNIRINLSEQLFIHLNEIAPFLTANQEMTK